MKNRNEFIEHTTNWLLELVDRDKGETPENLPDYFRGMFDLCIAFMMEEEKEGDGYNSITTMIAEESERLLNGRDID